MANIILRPEWHLPERLATPESVYYNRRKFMRRMGFAGAGLMAAGCTREEGAVAADSNSNGSTNAPAFKPGGTGYPYPRNPEYNPPWPLTNQQVATTYNNFYEFSTDKDAVHRLVDRFVIDPWSVDIGGLVDAPKKLDVDEIVKSMPLEERIYRFRCVEAWGMIVPWTGFPLSELLKKVQPKSDAKFVRFTTFFRPDQAPGFAQLSGYPWPYTEGLRMDEAMNPLTMVVTGIYGKPLPKQNGAPIRIVVPWKYGYKSIKSVVKIELVKDQPKTLWETLAPREYPFESNVDPNVPHPRWSQATERLVDTGQRIRTREYNGYGRLVASLY